MRRTLHCFGKAITQFRALLAVAICFLGISVEAKTLRLFVLTGQSNSLGTPTTNTEAVMVLPRVQSHHADEQVPFYWDNTADGTPAGDVGLGASGGWTNICLQQGGYYPYSADHWGPEVGFARLFWDAGYRDFGIVKASRGGGGNSFWNKTNADHHMYDKVVNTVSNAVLILPAGYTNHQVVGLLYAQGESNNSPEANEADVRFAMLMTNLQTDLANASGMQAVIGQIASDASGNRLITTQKQLALAAARPDIGFAQSTGLSVHNVDGQNVHYTADSLIILGERMASEAMLIGALPEKPVPNQTNLYAWYRSDHGAVPTGNGTVSRWDNLLSGATNRDLTQIVGGGPSLVNGSFLSSTQRHFIRFDGATQAAWATSGNFGFLNTARTLAFAVRVVGGNDGFLFDGSTGSGMSRAQVRTNSWQVGVQVGPASQGPNPDTPTAPRTTGIWQFHEFSFTPTNTGTQVRHWINGTNVADFFDPEPNGLGGFIVGANVQAQRFLAADIGEILIYAGELSDAARSNVLAYLQSNWANSEILTNPPAPNLPPFVTVFEAGVDGYTCFRIPALVTTTKGTVIAMTDGRIGGCGDIPTPLDLVIKRSFDNGKTWGPLQVVTDYGSNPNDVDTYPFYGLTNISRVSSGDAALLVDRTNGRIWTLYDNGGISGARKIKLEMKYSDDDGATWSPRIDVEALNPGLRTSTTEFLAGPGNGIQLTEGPHVGRLVFPVYAYNNPSASQVIYSDDHGATWTRSANAITNGGEIQVVELPGGELLASCRDNGFSWSGVRTFARSTDGGATWGLPYTSTANPPTIPDPQCQGNIYRLTTTNDSNVTRIIHANAAHPSSRVNMTLRISYDEGATWPVSNQVYAAGSAYSSVTKLATGDVGLLFEKDPYGSLAYTWRSVSDLTGGADSLPAYDVWKATQFSPAQLMDPAISRPNADPDGDGYNNEAEFTAGTNPLDGGSKLQLNLTPTPTNALLNFEGISNKTYTVQFRDALGTGLWQRYVDVGALPSNSTVVLALLPTNLATFFRLITPQLP